MPVQPFVPGLAVAPCRCLVFSAVSDVPVSRTALPFTDRCAVIALMVLQPIDESDARQLGELLHSIGMNARPDPQDALGFIKHLNSEKATGRKLVVDGVLVGGGQLTVQKHPHAVEIGFWVHRDQQRRGYGTCIAKGLIALAFDAGRFHRVFAKTFASNVASMRVLEKAGLELEATLRDVGYKDGTYVDEVYFALIDGGRGREG